MAMMDMPPTGGFANVGVGLECRHGGLDVAGRQRALVLADDVGLVEAGVRLQERRAVGMPARQRPVP